MRTFIMYYGAKIGKYPACVKTLEFKAKAEIVRSAKWIGRQISVIYCKSGFRILFHRHFNSSPCAKSRIYVVLWIT